MANKTLGSRQKLSFRIAPSQRMAKPHNPLALLAKQRAAGPHRKSASSARQAARLEMRNKLKQSGSE